MSLPSELKGGGAVSDRSLAAQELKTRDDITSPIERPQQERSSSLASSRVSMSDQTLNPPIRISGDDDPESREQVDRAGSPVPSCVSMKSDASMDHPSSLKEDFSPDESGAWPGGVACDLCTERRVRAVKFCQTCTASYCETHVRQHYTVPALQRHTLEEAPADLQPELCPQHHRALELFCNTDRTLICSVCLTQRHRGHDVVGYEPGTQGDVLRSKRVDGWIQQHHPTQDPAGVPPPPGQITFPTVGSDSVSLSWGVPEGMDKQALRFRVTWTSGTEKRNLTVKNMNCVTITSLSPGKQYTFSVATVEDNGTQSQRVSATVSTVIPAPVGLTVDSVTLTSLSLRWSVPHGLDQTPSFLVSYCSPGTELLSIYTESCSFVLSNLQPGIQYTVSACTVLENGEQSEAVSKTLCTVIPAPVGLTIDSVTMTSLSLRWSVPHGLDQTPSFLVSYCSPGTELLSIYTESCSFVLSNLQPGIQYTVSACTVLENGEQSEAVSKTLCTGKSAIYRPPMLLLL
ncbi:hypothetical protein AGOR_G00195180 [Albula goreensis]|uniref:Fibronectin-like n=1 Tax=Albula goreensis TaxID=1534307 RepID=A0A8T3CRU1_9TELE|nr:hypothetical protein AGOR_G00195180 [Albula goreensis]